VALAEAYLKVGKATEARAELERALVLDPASDAARRLLATLK
jgi:Tfp pilus assembly protein PilF